MDEIRLAKAPPHDTRGPFSWGSWDGALAIIERAWIAFHEGDREECRAALDDYRAWRARGGYDPELHEGEGPAGDRAADACERSLASLPPEPTHYAERCDADEEGGKRLIWVFDRAAVESWAAEHKAGAAVEAEDLLGGSARGTPGAAPGAWFWDAASVEIARRRVIVRQSGGYNI